MEFLWTTIQVKDMKDSLNFYQNIIGLSIQRRFNADENTEIVFLGDGETKIELVYMKKKIDISFGNDISLGFKVDSIDGMMKKLKENGIKIETEVIQPNPNVKFFYTRDPNGLKIQLVENS
ncbi:VOC family protein [Geotoga petraea]|uniref:VOC family protein n=1 Tax=Geotoga petraea TaxID=28234 RepID=A0A4Z0W6V4_9BACT|nr:VOC family protein [Geotoga petraea]TGG88864.1 VOC family protein [Geotoga petraea]